MEYKLWLMLLKVSNGVKLALLDAFNNEKELYYNFEQIVNSVPKMQRNFVNYNKKFALNEALKMQEWMDKNKVGFLSISDDEYPVNLKEINSAPYGLFYKGDKKILYERNVAIVGSRACTNYGYEVTRLLTNDLITYNISIISGGAKGIDSVAHKTCIENSGKTICVLGCGIDVVYPKQNKFLFSQIEQNGIIISEFLPGEKPYQYNFPRRNRIISGLSELVVVVEATDKSGSLITVNYALEQGREVMTVPGSVFSKCSVGCNKLMRDGARVLTSLEDLHDALKLKEHKRNEIVSPLGKKILKIISNEPVHIDEIINKSHIDRNTLFAVLFEMQIANRIISLPGNYYAKIT